MTGRQRCSLNGCENPAFDPGHPAPLCETHLSGSTPSQGGEEPDYTDATPGVEPRKPPLQNEGWSSADFTSPESGVWPPELLKREQWMGHREKKPYAPWADRDHPDADEDEDARWKWGLPSNYVDGETIALAEDDPRLDGRAFLQQSDDPYAYVDGDDVRCPETGDVHPAFVAILERLGVTYADVSQSGAGVHAQYKGTLPDDVKQAAWQLDTEPWGENDALPSIEIYAGKRVCVATGDHVPGTPTSVEPWEDDALYALLEENDQLPRNPSEVSTEPSDYVLQDYTPSATAADETTDDIRDIFAALDRLDARDVAEKTIVHRWNDDASTSEGHRAFVPSWGRNANGTANIVNDRIWQDTGDRGGYGGPVVMALIDKGELSERNVRPADAQGQLWWKGLEHLRDIGFPIPEYENQEHDQAAAEPVAVLPEDDEITHPGRSWRLHKDARHLDEGLTLDSTRQRTQDAIADIYGADSNLLLDALPGMGKTTGTVKAAQETGEPVTYLTNRHEVREKVMKQAEEYGLDAYSLPSFLQDCLTANGEFGEEWQGCIKDWYRRGATSQGIHKNAELELDRPLPCQEHEGQECPYTSKWRFNPDDYDIIVGHYLHGHNQKVTSGRNVVYDEFPADNYQTGFEGRMQAFITTYLQNESGLPFDDYTDLIEHRTDADQRARALAFYEETDLEPDSFLVFENDAGHAKAVHAVYTILAGATNDLDNGWEYATLPDGGVGIHDREDSNVYLIEPPDLQYASSILALDGTPTKKMWELSLGTYLKHEQILTDAERKEYITDVMNYRFVQTSEHMKPYSGNPDHVNVDDDAALLDGIHDLHDRKPVLISSKKALGVYEGAGVLSKTRATQHYGNLKSSNEFEQERLGVVIGSQHYGDKYIEKWGAFAGKCVEANRDEKTGEGFGTDLSYGGGIGDQIYQHMTHNETLQAAMRFGRDGNGSTVYVHTAALPEWVPVAGQGRVIKSWSEGMRQVLEAANGLGSWRTRDIAEHPDVTISERQVRSHLTELAERGYLSRRFEGRGYVWRDDGLHEVSDHGEVELDVVEDADVVAEVERMSTYTWNFRNYGGETASDAEDGGGEPQLLFPDGGVDDREDDPPPG